MIHWTNVYSATVGNISIATTGVIIIYAVIMNLKKENKAMILQSKYTEVDLKLRIAENRKELFDLAKKRIRSSFDQSLTSLEAESWIAIAKEKGFHELAEEMIIDLQTELSA